MKHFLTIFGLFYQASVARLISDENDNGLLLS